MKKINNYSTQYKIISRDSYRSFTLAPATAPATANAQNFTRSFAHSSATANAEQLHNQNHGKNTTNLLKKTLSKDRQEFINNISASGFKQFNL